MTIRKAVDRAEPKPSEPVPWSVLEQDFRDAAFGLVLLLIAVLTCAAALGFLLWRLL